MVSDFVWRQDKPGSEGCALLKFLIVINLLTNPIRLINKKSDNPEDSHRKANHIHLYGLMKKF
jgi:hypothetical protein